MRMICAIVVCFFMFSCTKYNYIDTGTVDGRFDGNMYEYLKSDHKNWDSVAKIIDRAGLEEMFRKENFTFFAPTNITIWKWFYNDTRNGGFDQAVAYVPHGYKCINDIDPAVCRRIVLSHVVDGKIMRDDFPRATFDEKGERDGGGSVTATRYGNKVWVWTIKENYMGFPEMGPVTLYIASLKADGSVYKEIDVVASPDHEPDNGVVHAMSYRYNLGELCDVMNDKK